MKCRKCGEEGYSCVCPILPLSENGAKLWEVLKDGVNTFGKGKRIPLSIDWPEDKLKAALVELEAKGYINTRPKK